MMDGRCRREQAFFYTRAVPSARNAMWRGGGQGDLLISADATQVGSAACVSFPECSRRGSGRARNPAAPWRDTRLAEQGNKPGETTGRGRGLDCKAGTHTAPAPTSPPSPSPCTGGKAAMIAMKLGRPLPFQPDLRRGRGTPAHDVCVVSVHKMGTRFEQGSVFPGKATSSDPDQCPPSADM